MPKYLCFVRTSPFTENDGTAQQSNILAGLQILHDHDEINDFSINDVKFYNAIDVARSEVLDSVEVYKLFQTIETADPKEAIVVVVSKLDRLGIVLNKISFFLDYIQNQNHQVQFISIKEYGLDPYEVGRAIADYYTSRQLIAKQSSHCDPGKSLPVNVDDEMNQKRVNEKSKQIKKIWEGNNDDLPQRIYPMSIIDTRSNDHDASRLAQLDIMHTWINHSLHHISNDSQHQIIQDVVKKFIDERLVPTEGNQFIGQTHFIYLRNSPSIHCPSFIDGLPQDQLSMCLAYWEVMQSYKGPWSVVYDSFEARSKTGRDGVAYLFAAVLYGKVEHVTMKNVNRLSSNSFLWVLFIEACKQRGVEIHIADGIGKDVMDMVTCDDERQDDLNVTNDELHATIDIMRERLTNGKTKRVLEILAKADMKK